MNDLNSWNVVSDRRVRGMPNCQQKIQEGKVKQVDKKDNAYMNRLESDTETSNESATQMDWKRRRK